MVDKYFSEREQGSPQRTKEEISLPVWGGIVAVVEGLVTNGTFEAAFPEECPDGYGTIGTDERSMALMVKAEIPELPWPLKPNEVPSIMIILDFIEFCHDRVAEPHQKGYHDFFRHYHLSFNWRLIMAPDFVIRYLVTHGAVHLKVPDHSKRFWLTVQSLCPAMDQARQWLSANSHRLMVDLREVALAKGGGTS